MNTLYKTVMFVGALHLAIPVAQADESPAATGEKVDYLVPDSPALSLIGVAAEKTLRPQSPKALVTDLRTAFDENGKLKSTISLAGTPYLLLWGDEVTLDDYQGSQLVRALSNTELSLVGARGESTNDADRFSVGLRWNVFDDGDPREVVVNCVTEVSRAAAANDPFEMSPEEIKAAEDRAREDAKACYKDWRKNYWNAQALDIGLAYAWADGGTNLSGIEEESFGAYVSWSFPVSGQDGQIVTHARYTIDQLAVNKAGAFFNQDTGYAGARWRHKLGPRSAINLEAGYTFTDPSNLSSDSYTEYGVSFEYRISEDVWLVASTGGRSDAANEDDDLRALAALKWNLANAASIFE